MIRKNLLYVGLIALISGILVPHKGVSADIKTSPAIGGDNIAKRRCPDVCKEKNLSWNGVWKKSKRKYARTSVCTCLKPIKIETLPILDGADARKKCSKACTEKGMNWYNAWSKKGSYRKGKKRMSVCTCLKD